MAASMTRSIETAWKGTTKNMDEELANKAAQIRIEKQINQQALWSEEVEDKCSFKRSEANRKQMQHELRMAAKAAVEVRRVALRKLLEKDFAIYEQELNTLGKAFYKQRE